MPLPASPFRLLPALLLWLALPGADFAQVTGYEAIGTEQGLSQGMVNDMIQGRDGFVWIATKDGLNRYDGSRFKIFSPAPFDPFAIGFGSVESLFEDSRGWIWVGAGSGLDIFDPASGRFFHLRYEGKPFNSTWAAKCIEGPDGAIWMMHNHRILKTTVEKDMLAKAIERGSANIELSCKSIPLTNINGWSGGPLEVSNLNFRSERELLITTNHGLFQLDPVTEQLSPKLLMPGHNILYFATAKSGEILTKFDFAPNGAKWGRLSGGNTQIVADASPLYSVSPFIFDDAGFFWAYREGKIQKWQPSAFFEQGKPTLEIGREAFGMQHQYHFYATCFLQDKSGIVWMGTNGYGVVKINDKGTKFKTVLPSTSHRLIVEDPAGKLYCSPLPYQAFLSKNFDHGIPNSDVPLFTGRGAKDVAFDAVGNIWSVAPSDSNQLDEFAHFFKTDPAQRNNKEGLCRIDAVTKQRRYFPFEGYALICDRNGKMVSVNAKGLHRFDPATETSQHFPFDKPEKWTSFYGHFLYEDSDGTLWIFGIEGLIKAVPNQNGYVYQHFLNNPADRSSLPINVVSSVADDPLDPRRFLWVGTKGCGLARLDKQSGKFKQFSREQGLPDNVVYGILPENPKPAAGSHFIWMSTNKGLCRFDVRAETAKNFTVADGLQDNEFNSASYLKTRDGAMIFGGVKGLTVFHPDSLRFNKNIPQIHIVGLWVNNQPFDCYGTSHITLSHEQNLLTFDFAALEFTHPAQNQYRYQLVGVDKDWIPLGNRNSIQFANLAPGDYTFRVEGSNNDGTWSEQPAELRFTIRPPWWASWWAYLIYLGMAAAAARFFYRYRLRQKLEQQETLRLREMDDFKSRFFTNITHEFRTPLTVILGMTEQLAQSEAEAPKQNKLGLIKRNSENLLRLINQILDLAKLESKTLKINYVQGDVLAFLRYIAESLHSLANAQNLMLRVESDQSTIVMDYDPERLLQIVHNLLSNAIKFTPSGGRVVMSVSIDLAGFGNLPGLNIRVTDTGAGIPADELPHLFERFFQAKNQEHAKAGGTGIGLSLVAELVKALGGEISVESAVGKGSTFWVKLPVTNKGAWVEKGENMVFENWEPSAAKLQLLPPGAGLADDARPQILLIEDNPDVVEYLAACLSSPAGGGREGVYQLDFAYNGRAGIEKALENVPDLIVSDVMMPEKDGFEVVEALKNDERTSHIPIILLTAKADVQSRLTGLRRGADAYLSKPFHQEELLVTVRNLLEMRRRLQAKYQQNILAAVPVEPARAAPDADVEDAFLQQVRAVVEANYTDDGFGLPQLCQKIGMSRSQLFRKMKALTDMAPSDLIRMHRLNKAKALLESGAANVSEAAWQVGFKDPHNFSTLYQETFGEAPSATRK